MNATWNLDRIYRSFDDPSFTEDFSALKTKTAAFAAFAGTLGEIAPIDGLRLGISAQEDLMNLAYKLAGYASLRQAADTRDTEAGSRMGLEVTHVNLLDNTVEGLRSEKDRVFSVQYHPESAPGPQDSTYLFDEFIRAMEGNSHA